VIFRHAVVSKKDLAVAEYLTANFRPQDYRRIELEYPDIPFDNREAPDEHLYRTVTVAPPVVVYQRIVP
jgi:hypothetical protein